MKEDFELKPVHIQLLRKMCVGWQDCEFGAPEIDPKRPYGNSDVIDDMREILDDYAKGYSDEFLEKLHKETETALQIVLTTGAFEPGFYVSELYGDWKKKP